MYLHKRKRALWSVYFIFLFMCSSGCLNNFIINAFFKTVADATNGLMIAKVNSTY